MGGAGVMPPPPTHAPWWQPQLQWSPTHPTPNEMGPRVPLQKVRLCESQPFSTTWLSLNSSGTIQASTLQQLIQTIQLIQLTPKRNSDPATTGFTTITTTQALNIYLFEKCHLLTGLTVIRKKKCMYRVVGFNFHSMQIYAS